jgi:N-acetylmuramoyl-L-alanine amidase
MPAVLVEIGYLTNPSEEKRLNDRGHLTGLARKISRGIDDFFKLEK